jgi:hypothetical protein
MGKTKTVRKADQTSSEVESPEAILKAAEGAKYDMLAFARVARQTAAALRSERFELNRAKSIDGNPIHYFRVRGESVTGTLGKPTSESFGGVTYPLILDDGTVVRIPGNRDLQRKIKRLKCVYMRITIEYLGKRNLTSAHYEKIYAIHPAPLGSIIDTPEGRDALKNVAAAAGIKPPSEKPKRKSVTQISEDPQAVRRRFLKGMISDGKTPSAKSLKEFRGEAWADKSLAEAK